jgi:glucokinase
VQKQLNDKIYTLAIDIGGTKMDIAFIDQFGSYLEPSNRLLVPFDKNGVADPEKILDLLTPYVERAKYEFSNFPGIGLSVCGNINKATGEAVLVANLHWRNVPFRKMAADRFGVPIFSATDVHMALVAEIVWGHAKGYRNVAWMTLGTGYGGYLFLDGKLYDGTHGFAGNLGHSIYDERGGDLCGCGQHGCFESYVSGPAIAKQGQQAVDQGQSRILGELVEKYQSPVTTKMVFEAEALGDPSAIDIIEGVVRKLGISLSSMVNLLDLDMIILGGGVWKGSPNFLPRVDQAVRNFAMTDEAKRDLKIVRESFENSALVGAAAYAFYKNGIITL